MVRFFFCQAEDCIRDGRVTGVQTCALPIFDRRRLAFLEDEIVERAWNSGLAADCGLVKGEPNRQAIAKLDAQLCDIKELSIRDGLHVFGRTPDEATVQALATVTGREVAIRACGARERAALVAALDGRRVAAGPAG